MYCTHIIISHAIFIVILIEIFVDGIYAYIQQSEGHVYTAKV